MYCQFLWNLVKMTSSWEGEVAGISAWLDKNCGFFINNQLFLPASNFLHHPLWLSVCSGGCRWRRPRHGLRLCLDVEQLDGGGDRASGRPPALQVSFHVPRGRFQPSAGALWPHSLASASLQWSYRRPFSRGSPLRTVGNKLQSTFNIVKLPSWPQQTI